MTSAVSKKKSGATNCCPWPRASATKNVVRFHSSATIYRGELDPGRAISYETTEDRRIFLYLTSGKLVVNRTRLLPKYQARIDLEKKPYAAGGRKIGFHPHRPAHLPGLGL